MTRVLVDRDLCQGYSQCNALAPEVFELDDDGIAVVVGDGVAAGAEERVAAAVLRCPSGAIRSDGPGPDGDR